MADLTNAERQRRFRERHPQRDIAYLEYNLLHDRVKRLIQEIEQGHITGSSEQLTAEQMLAHVKTSLAHFIEIGGPPFR